MTSVLCRVEEVEKGNIADNDFPNIPPDDEIVHYVRNPAKRESTPKQILFSQILRAGLNSEDNRDNAYAKRFSPGSQKMLILLLNEMNKNINKLIEELVTVPRGKYLNINEQNKRSFSQILRNLNEKQGGKRSFSQILRYDGLKKQDKRSFSQILRNVDSKNKGKRSFSQILRNDIVPTKGIRSFSQILRHQDFPNTASGNSL